MATKKMHEFAKRYVGIEQTGLSDDKKRELHYQLRSEASSEGFDLSSISFNNIVSQHYDSLKAENERDNADNLQKLKEEFARYRNSNP
jgi:hypothetical protein